MLSLSAGTAYVRIMKQTANLCPNCGSDGAVPIAYGYPDMSVVMDEMAGKLVIGGCDVRNDNPHWACRACNARWQKGFPSPWTFQRRRGSTRETA